MVSKYGRSIFFLVFLLTGIPAYASGIDDADERLFKVQLAIAEKGNTRAQYYLGEMHENGLGTKPDLDEAFKWYAKAAEQGDALAKRKLQHRQEITDEFKREQQTDKLGTQPAPKAVVERPAPAKPAPRTVKKSAPAVAHTPSPAPEPKITMAQADDHSAELERKRAAEKAKRRAAVRAIILDRIRNPVGELFE